MPIVSSAQTPNDLKEELIIYLLSEVKFHQKRISMIKIDRAKVYKYYTLQDLARAEGSHETAVKMLDFLKDFKFEEKKGL